MKKYMYFSQMGPPTIGCVEGIMGVSPPNQTWNDILACGCKGSPPWLTHHC